MRLNLLLVAAAALVAISNAAPQSPTSVTKVSTDAAPARFLRAEAKTQVDADDSFDPEEEERVITFHGKLDKVDDILAKMNLADDAVLKKLLAKGKSRVEQLVTNEQGVKKITVMTKKGKRTFTDVDIKNMRRIESTPAIKNQIQAWKKAKLPPRAASQDLVTRGIPKTKDNVLWEAFRLYSATSGRKFNSLSPTGF